MEIKNWNDLLEIVSSVKTIEELNEVFSESNELIKSLSKTIFFNDKVYVKNYAFQDLENYILEIKPILNPDSFDFLIFKDVRFAKQLFEIDYELFLTVIDSLELTPFQKYNLLNELNYNDEIELEYNVSEESLNLKNGSRLNFLLKDIQITKDDDFELLYSVVDVIPMDLVVHDEFVSAIVLNKKRNELEENKDSLRTKLKTICAKVISSPVTKYAGIVLALGLTLTGTSEASMVDAIGYVDVLNQNLSELALNAPNGCNFGAEVVSNNGMIMEFQVQLGDFVVDTKVTDFGSTLKRMEQTVSQLQEVKGCGLSKADVSQLAKQIGSSVQKIAAN